MPDVHFDFPALSPGLYVVATPIGNRSDITYRALDTLNSVDLIACEDTRVTQKLLESYGVSKKLVSYHDHNESARTPELLNKIEKGLRVAIVSDAGMPLVSDPGYRVVHGAIERNLPITIIPGPSAVLSALVLSGLATDQFAFIGFYDAQRLAQLQNFKGSIIFFEAPHRLLKTLEELHPEQPCVVARELTKKFEEVLRGNVGYIREVLSQRDTIRGEIVVVLGPYEQSVTDDVLLHSLVPLLDKMSVKEASESLAQALQIPRKRIYQLALRLKNESDR